MKAQIKIQQMAFMLVAVFFFFILVGLFAATFLFHNVAKHSNEIAREKTILALNNIASSAEFTCGEPNCIDLDKMIVLKNLKDYQNYFDFAGLVIITETGINKDENQMIECTTTNYPACDKITILNKTKENLNFQYTYTTLCRKHRVGNYIFDKCEVGIIMAAFEIKK